MATDRQILQTLEYLLSGWMVKSGCKWFGMDDEYRIGIYVFPVGEGRYTTRVDTPDFEKAYLALVDTCTIRALADIADKAEDPEMVANIFQAGNRI